MSPRPLPATPPDAPLRPTDLLVLLMLAPGDRHGYGIMQDVESFTDGRVLLEAGSLYRTIRRLSDEGLLTESGRRPAAEKDDERRRYYRLTPLGRRVVTAEVERMRGLVRLAEAADLVPRDGR